MQDTAVTVGTGAPSRPAAQGRLARIWARHGAGYMAMAGSTNAMIHLIAIARRCGVALTLDDFDRVSAEVPVLCNIRPTGEYLMEDFYYAGGLIALWKQLKPLLHTAERNVIGTIGGALDEAEVHLPEVIRPLDRPVAARGGTAILKGNLAPQGCVMPM